MLCQADFGLSHNLKLILKDLEYTITHNMTERGNQSTETAEQIGEKLMEFIKETEFDTPQYQAVSDYLFLKQSERTLQLEKKNGWESEARVSEQKIALFQLFIYQNQSRLKGYDSAYAHVGIEFEHSLVSAARKEAEHLFPEKREQQDYYVSNLFETFLDHAQGIINTKRG